MSLISIDEARDRILAAVRPLPSETVAVADGIDRVLAHDVRAAGDVPPFPCSAMDGYAIVAAARGTRLRVVGESRAGAPASEALGPHEAIRISTGAAIPTGATAVVPQEDVTSDDDGAIVLTADVTPGAHLRGAGEDMRADATVLDAGTPLGPIELGAAIAAGVGRLEVAVRPRVTVIATGDELREPGEPLGPGEIHNSNATMLAGLARRCGAEATTAPPPPDDLAATTEAIAAALRAADVVVLSGGVSVGPHDHVRPALAALGVTESFWRVALQPGKPTWFGCADDGRLVFGLPGNPVSSVVTFSLFVAPALAALLRGPAPRPPHAAARLAEPVHRNPQRDQAVRVTLRTDPRGALVAAPTGPQGSHILTSLLHADALALIPAGDGTLAAGDTVALRALVR